jgi:hypothetical protein
MIRKSLIVILSAGAIATLVLGFISYRRGIPDDAIWIGWFAEKPRVQAAMVRGTLHAVYSDPIRPSGKINPAAFGGSGATGLDWQFAGFYVRSRTIGATSAFGVGVPFWSPVPLLLVYPIATLLRGPLRRRRRRKRGLCIRCGYNLTGLTEPRCPECAEPFIPRGSGAGERAGQPRQLASI